MEDITEASLFTVEQAKKLRARCSLSLSPSLPSSLFLLLHCLTTKSLPLNRDNYRGNDKLFSRFDLLANRLGSLINRRFNETSEKTREGCRMRRSSRMGDSNC